MKIGLERMNRVDKALLLGVNIQDGSDLMSVAEASELAITYFATWEKHQSPSISTDEARRIAEKTAVTFPEVLKEAVAGVMTLDLVARPHVKAQQWESVVRSSGYSAKRGSA